MSDKIEKVISQLAQIDFPIKEKNLLLLDYIEDLELNNKDVLNSIVDSMYEQFCIELEYREDTEEEERQEYNILKELDDTIDGFEYEHKVAELINTSERNWTAEVSQATGDQGLDVLATHTTGVTVAIQTKRYSSPVGNKAVQEVFSAMSYYTTDFAMVVTNSSFTNSAINLAQRTGIILTHHYDVIESLSKLVNTEEFI